MSNHVGECFLKNKKELPLCRYRPSLRALRPDVVHLVLAPSFFAYLPLFRLLPYPTVLTLAGERLLGLPR